MESSSIARRHIHLIDDEKFNLYTLIWLDKKCKEDCLDSLHTRTLLKQTNNNNCIFYDDIELFYDDINKKVIFQSKTLLIVSGLFAEIILKDKIREKISSMIIFCHHIDKYKKYSNSVNVIDICTDYNLLKISIERVLPSLKFNLFENRSLNTICSLTTTSYNNTATLFSYILFVEILKQVPQSDQAKDFMLNKIKDYYQDDKSELEKIELFRKEYSSSKAIQWYTKDSFVYRLINKAFRTDDTSMWYIFRFFISDLCNQIEQVHEEQNLKEFYILYRGQSHLPKQELDNIKANIGGLISSNGFFSTSKSFLTAFGFLGGAKDTENSRAVIFQVTVDSVNLKNTIFVDVDQHLRQDYEHEILFNIGTVFKIESIEQEKDFWRIQMNATDEGTTEIKQRINLIKNRFQTMNINLLFGKLLIDMHQYDKAEVYFNMMLQVLSEQHPDLPSIYDHIGDLKMHTNNYYGAFHNFNLSYHLKCKALSSKHPDMSITFNHLGNYYKAIGDMTKAHYYYKKALKYKNNSINIAITKLNIAIIYMEKQHYNKARDSCLDAREILQQVQPSPYAEILVCQGLLGDILLKQHKYNEAKDFYLTTFEMGKKYLSIGDPRLICCIYALADLYEKQIDQTYAMEFCLEQLYNHEKYLFNTNHISIAHIQMKIGHLSDDINWYKKAIIIFKNNIHLDYAATANCFIKLAQYSQDDQALLFYTEAIQIQKKIYPPNHLLIITTQKQLNKIKIVFTNLSIEKILQQFQTTNDELRQQVQPEIGIETPVIIHQLNSDDDQTNIDVESVIEDSMNYRNNQQEIQLPDDMKHKSSICIQSTETIKGHENHLSHISTSSMDSNQHLNTNIKIPDDYYQLKIENLRLKYQIELMKIKDEQMLFN